MHINEQMIQLTNQQDSQPANRFDAASEWNANSKKKSAVQLLFYERFSKEKSFWRMHIFEAKFSGFALGNVTMCVCVCGSFEFVT